ncbi:MAG: UDP-glucose 4-epimerase GalE, partial [Candidatus Paceibacterales bacterium]
MKTILVTGGAGYIGGHFVNTLRKLEGYKIEVVDNFSQSRNNIVEDPNIAYYEVDLRDKQKLLEIVKQTKPDMVVHFAGLASVPDSVAKPFDYYENNIIGGLNLLEAMREVGTNKIIFSSSAAVYGEPIMEEIKEDHPKNPTNPYGYTKLVFENMLKHYSNAYGLNSIALRYFCAAGCNEALEIGEYHNPETHVIPCIIQTILGQRSQFHVFGNDYPTPDGTGIRDYIHVDDLAQAHLKAMEKLIS